MIIGITDPMRDAATYESYASLVSRWIPKAETQILSCVKGTFSEFERCDALVLSGGGDVHPKFYGRGESADVARGVSPIRDLFEFDIIREALERSLPVLGICRGAQVYNVAMGGTLIVDLETAGYASHRNGDTAEGSHGVTVAPGSLLQSTVGCASGLVNTYHHQAVETVGKGLCVTARSDDGVIEALEWKEPEGKPFLLLVQWHPERMSDVHSPFAKNLIERFATEIRSTQ